MCEPGGRVERPRRSLGEVKVQAGVAKSALAVGGGFAGTAAAALVAAVQAGIGDRAVQSGLFVICGIAGLTLVTAAVMVRGIFKV
ncbi:hypothetical protein Ahu01nite_090000 [Winogradskya humida]|uniref:Uncharacterized protein n=1 Tax=Winogradskya humida TaxID=113566 RepID=A0ABQ4A5I6_9ACTN|nr:hypothetical protein Ahu01nite_090000 [Actinoplanes humidus]